MSKELVTRHLRIHPHMPQKGYRVRRYNIFGVTFDEARGWYEARFTEAQFDILRGVRNNEEDADSKPVFDICTTEERRRLEAVDKKAREPRVSAAPIVDLTTADLRRLPEGRMVSPEPILEDGQDLAASPSARRKLERPAKKVAACTPA